MYDTLGSQAANKAYASDCVAVSSSRLDAITARVKGALDTVREANKTASLELERLLGPAVLANGSGGESPTSQPMGILGQLDDLCSQLLGAVDHGLSLAARLSQV